MMPNGLCQNEKQMPQCPAHEKCGPTDLFSEEEVQSRFPGNRSNLTAITEEGNASVFPRRAPWAKGRASGIRGAPEHRRSIFRHDGTNSQDDNGWRSVARSSGRGGGRQVGRDRRQWHTLREGPVSVHSAEPWLAGEGEDVVSARLIPSIDAGEVSIHIPSSRFMLCISLSAGALGD